MGVRSWFDDNLRRVVGDEVNTFFWTDQWVGGVLLSVKFCHMFELSKTWEMTVVVMFSLGWEWAGNLRSSGGGCLRERKRWSGSVVHCFIILFCRLTRRICGNCFWSKQLIYVTNILLVLTLLREYTFLHYC